MRCCFFIAEHVGVRGQDGRSRLLRDAGGLRSSLALVHQLLHCVCDALITRKSEKIRRKVFLQAEQVDLVLFLFWVDITFPGRPAAPLCPPQALHSCRSGVQASEDPFCLPL